MTDRWPCTVMYQCGSLENFLQCFCVGVFWYVVVKMVPSMSNTVCTSEGFCDYGIVNYRVRLTSDIYSAYAFRTVSLTENVRNVLSIVVLTMVFEADLTI